VGARSDMAPEAKRTGRSPSYGALARLLIALVMVVGSAAAVFWESPAISDFYFFLSHPGVKPQGPAGHQSASAQPKLGGRVPQQQSAAKAPETTIPGGEAASAQRVVLYEEYPTDPQGKRYTGSAVWRTEPGSTGPGVAKEIAIRADVTIPELGMAVAWVLRPGADKGAYTIETTFNLPADFPGGAVANVPGILMKQSEQAHGTPLAGLTVKVTNGFFVIGLSTDDTSAQHNEQLLKESSWFDIPIIYSNGGRAILAIEKGLAGDRAFAAAFGPRAENKWSLVRAASAVSQSARAATSSLLSNPDSAQYRYEEHLIAHEEAELIALQYKVRYAARLTFHFDTSCLKTNHKKDRLKSSLNPSSILSIVHGRLPSSMPC